MKGIIISISTLVLLACSSTINDTTTSTLVEKTNSNHTYAQNTGSVTKTLDNEVKELVPKWTWNDNAPTPLKSSITNTNFSSDLLLKTWTWSGNYKNQPALTFEKDSLTIHGEKKYIYTINYDSLRVFTSYDHSGGGITRGIITKLTKDSLIIKWSTDDMNKYVTIKPN